MKIQLNGKKNIVEVDENENIEEQLAEIISEELNKLGFETYSEVDGQIVSEAENLHVWVAVNYNEIKDSISYDVHYEDQNQREPEPRGAVNRKSWAGLVTYIKNYNY